MKASERAAREIGVCYGLRDTLCQKQLIEFIDRYFQPLVEAAEVVTFCGNFTPQGLLDRLSAELIKVR